MLRLVKIAIILMTLAIVVLSSLIIHKIFTSSSSSTSKITSKTIELPNTSIKTVSANEDELILLTNQNEIIIISKSTGKQISHFTLKEKIED